MRKFFFSVFCAFSLVATAQEEFSVEESFFIGAREIPPALTSLSPLIPPNHFQLTDADIFKKDEERKINMLGIVEREKRFQERIQEYETPIFQKQREESSIQFSQNVDLFNRGSNYDIYTGQLKNPVYKEMQARMYNEFNSPFYRPHSPYYSPFLR